MDVMVTEEPGYIGTFRMVLLPVLNILIVGVFMKSQLRHEDMVMGYLKFVPDGMGRYWEVSGYNIQMFGKNTVQRSAFRKSAGNLYHLSRRWKRESVILYP